MSMLDMTRSTVSLHGAAACRPARASPQKLHFGREQFAKSLQFVALSLRA